MNKTLGILALISHLGAGTAETQNAVIDYREQFVRVMDCKGKTATITFESMNGIQQKLNFEARTGEEIKKLREESGNQSYTPLLPKYVSDFIEDCLSK